jgi:hypothetical protein
MGINHDNLGILQYKPSIHPTILTKKTKSKEPPG